MTGSDQFHFFSFNSPLSALFMQYNCIPSIIFYLLILLITASLCQPISHIEPPGSPPGLLLLEVRYTYMAAKKQDALSYVLPGNSLLLVVAVLISIIVRILVFSHLCHMHFCCFAFLSVRFLSDAFFPYAFLFDVFLDALLFDVCLSASL